MLSIANIAAVCLFGCIVVAAAASADTRNLNATGCACKGYDCGCCAQVVIKRIELNDTGCLNITYLPSVFGISLTFSINGIVLVNRTVSARDPPDICFGIPYLEEVAKVCIKFYDMDLANRTFSGCAKLEAKLEDIVVAKVDLGCFNIPLPAGYDANLANIIPIRLQHITRMHKLVNAQSIEDLQSYGCNCQGYKCGCCVNVAMMQINETGCVNMTIDPKNLTVTMIVTFNGVVEYKRTISARDPPAVCVQVPLTYQTYSLCLKFYDIDFSNHTIYGCIKGELENRHQVKKSVDIGCYRFPLEIESTENRLSAIKLSHPDIKATGCNCRGYSCACCADIIYSRFDINDTACANVTVDPSMLNASVALSLNGQVWYKKSISVHDPPDVCLPIHIFEGKIGVCIKFYNLSLASRSMFSGCMKGELTDSVAVFESVDLGCFKIPLPQKSIISNDIKVIAEQTALRKLNETGCVCKDDNCGCCATLAFSDFKACANLSYIPATDSVRMTLTLTGQTLVNITFSIRNVPDICVPVPYTGQEYGLCIQFYNLSLGNASIFYGCIKAQLKQDDQIVESLELGCFHLPLITKQNKIHHSWAEVEQNARTEAESIKIKDIPVLQKLDQTGCECRGYDCGCCATAIGVDACVNMTYLPTSDSIMMTVTMAGQTLVNMTFSVASPPDLCVPVPYTGKEFALCIQFSNFSLSNTSIFYGCINAQVKMDDKIVENVELGCFRLPLPKEKNKIHHRHTKIGNVNENQMSAVQNVDESECICKGYDCGCCTEFLYSNLKACANLTYVPATDSVRLTLTFSGKTLANITFSVRNPPDICLPVPYTGKEFALCIQFYNVSLGNTSIFYGCLKGQLKEDSEIVESIELGCFRLPLPKKEKFHGISLKEWNKMTIQHDPMNDPKINRLPDIHRANKAGCICNGTKCGCCTTIMFTKKKFCANMTYFPDDSNIMLTLSYNGQVVFNETFSAENPPPLCVPVPLTSRATDLCMKFYQMKFTKDKVSGCAELEIRRDDQVVESIDLGCFSFPFGNKAPKPVDNTLKFISMIKQRANYRNFDRYL